LQEPTFRRYDRSNETSVDGGDFATGSPTICHEGIRVPGAVTLRDHRWESGRHLFGAQVPGSLVAFYNYNPGNSARGIDFPSLGVDIKVTSIEQPQSSSPFTSARQKIFGLGYSLLVFVYEKKDDSPTRTATLNMMHVIFIEKEQTADFQMTTGIAEILARKENLGVLDDLVAFMQDKNLPVGDIEARQIAEEIVKRPPALGYLTISNALQWRLQYTRVIAEAGKIPGILRIK
jgi:hypothetical protein